MSTDNILTDSETKEIQISCQKIMVNLLENMKLSNIINDTSLHNIFVTIFYLLQFAKYDDLLEIETLCKQKYDNIRPSDSPEIVIH
ncbi:MAG: hypothetical protein PHD05_00245 [Sphaerochaetaceae bacterium]|nr:hypothetical protein [Sphaerochaetaceae bacterium]